MLKTLAAAAALLAVSSAAHDLAAQEVRIGSFVYVQSADPIDDSNRSFIAAMQPDDDSDAAITWRCMEDGLNVVLEIGKYYGGDDDDEIQVITRVDQDPNSGIVYWPLLQGNTAAYMPMDRVEAFTERAKRARQIAIRAIDPLDGETLTFVFPVLELERALERLGKCD
jgi:hypothetical protein